MGGAQSLHSGGGVVAVRRRLFRDGDDLGSLSAGSARQWDAVEDDGPVSDRWRVDCGAAGNHDRTL